MRSYPNSVYFARSETTGLIKIGCSAYPKGRLKQLSWDLKEQIRLIVSAKGSFHDERRIHRELSEKRVHGEWFEDCPEVMAYIGHVTVHGTLPPPTGQDRDSQVASQFLAGDTLKAIGDRFGITRERVRQIARERGLPARRAA